MKRIGLFFGLLLISTAAFGMTEAQLKTALETKYDAYKWPPDDGSSVGTKVRKSILVLPKAVNGIRPETTRVDVWFDTSTGKYEWLGRDPVTVVTPTETFDSALNAYLRSFITNGTIVAYEVLVSNEAGQFAVVKAWMATAGHPTKTYLLDKDAQNAVRIREIAQ
jgi:hypothetical protein